MAAVTCHSLHLNLLLQNLCWVYLEGNWMNILFCLLWTKVEFYFGDANLQKDRFMKQEISQHPEGCKYTIFYYIFNLPCFVLYHCHIHKFSINCFWHLSDSFHFQLTLQLITRTVEGGVGSKLKAVDNSALCSSCILTL